MQADQRKLVRDKLMSEISNAERALATAESELDATITKLDEKRKARDLARGNVAALRAAVDAAVAVIKPDSE